MIDAKHVALEAVEKVNNITPSVLVLARVMKVTPEAFAKAIYDVDANTDFITKLYAAVVPEAVAAAKKAEKKSKKDEE